MFKYNYKNKNKKHVFVCMLCFALFLLNIFSAMGGIFAVDNKKSSQVLAADLWSDYTEEATKDRDGYRIINTPEKLSWFFNQSTETKAKLVCDIDMSAHEWNAKGMTRKLEFDGTGHVISGLKNASSNFWGLISEVTSGTLVFKNLNINISVTYKSASNCYIGGFVGKSSNGTTVTIQNCSVCGSITLNATGNTSNSIKNYVGGFIGFSERVELSNCINSAIITLNADIPESSQPIYYIGGLVGYSNTNCKLRLCGNLAKVIATAKYLGGLVGYANIVDLIDCRCFNSGVVKNNIGTVVEKEKWLNISIDTKYYTHVAYTGGLVGFAKTVADSTISYVYNTNHIYQEIDTKNTLLPLQPKYYTGGFIGGTDNGVSFSEVYNKGTVEGNNLQVKIDSSITYEDIENDSQTKGKWYQADGGDYVESPIEWYFSSSNYIIEYTPNLDYSYCGDTSQTGTISRGFVTQPSSVSSLVSSKYVFKFNIKESYGGHSDTCTIKLSKTNTYKKGDSGYELFDGSSRIQGTTQNRLIDSNSQTFYQAYGTYYHFYIIGVAWYIEEVYSDGFVVNFCPYIDITHHSSKEEHLDYYMWKAFHLTYYNYYCTNEIDISNSYYSKTSQIKSAFADYEYFKTSPNINNGFPAFKEMYWELS